MIRDAGHGRVPTPHAGTPRVGEDTPERLPGAEPTDLQTCRPQPRRFARVLSGAGAVWQEVACPRRRALVAIPAFAVPPFSRANDGDGFYGLFALLFGIGLSLAAVIGVGLYWRWRKSRVPLADSDVQVPNLFASGVREPDPLAPPRGDPHDDTAQRRRGGVARGA